MRRGDNEIGFILMMMMNGDLELRRVTVFTAKLVWGEWVILQLGAHASHKAKF